MKTLLIVLTTFMLAAAAKAETPTLKPELAGLTFLVGRWISASPGTVLDTGGSSAGDADFSSAVSGSVLLRRDHVILRNKRGKMIGDFDILMTIYSDAGVIQADYFDGEHHIHYASADIEPGRSVVFTSAPTAKASTFKLSYRLQGLKVLDVAFSMAPPSGGEFHPIASGRMAKVG